MHAYLSFWGNEHIVDVKMIEGSFVIYLLEKVHNQ